MVTFVKKTREVHGLLPVAEVDDGRRDFSFIVIAGCAEGQNVVFTVHVAREGGIPHLLPQREERPEDLQVATGLTLLGGGVDFGVVLVYGKPRS